MSHQAIASSGCMCLHFDDIFFPFLFPIFVIHLFWVARDDTLVRINRHVFISDSKFDKQMHHAFIIFSDLIRSRILIISTHIWKGKREGGLSTDMYIK